MPRLLQSRVSLIVLFMLIALMAACSPSAASTPTSAPEPTSAPTVVETASEATAEATVETAIEATAEADSTEVTSLEQVTATCTLLNLNTVTQDELINTMPDFSSRMVREFFEYRPYVSIQQFRREIGKYVDDSQVTAWEAYIYVPVDFNESDEATLQQIPGVDEASAAALTARRPYVDQQAFLDALSATLSTEQVAQATCYLAGA